MSFSISQKQSTSSLRSTTPPPETKNSVKPENKPSNRELTGSLGFQNVVNFNDYPRDSTFPGSEICPMTLTMDRIGASNLYGNMLQSQLCDPIFTNSNPSVPYEFDFAESISEFQFEGSAPGWDSTVTIIDSTIFW
jgi:hypothetical protein